MSADPTGSQTVGPFFHYGLMHEDLALITAPGAGNRQLTITGRVSDGKGEAVPDAMLEFWHPTSGFARVATDGQGVFTARLPVPQPDQRNGAPYLSVALFARGLLRHLYTRCYLPDHPALAGDSVLRRVPAERRPTLIAKGGDGAVRFDVVMQGERETVFFDV